LDKTIDKETLKNKVIQALKEQGFEINPHLRPTEDSKEWYKKIQEKGRIEQLSIHKNFLQANINKVKKYCRDGKDIVPEKIVLELREVKAESFEETLFRWWNLIWWSIPYQRSYGRQMRFLLWDVAHDSPFGLISLQSAVLKMSVRDKFLGLPKNELDIWVNKSMNAQRVGALPPYNDLIGGKMVALALTANEIRERYREKYVDYISVIKSRKLESDLLFITTTSAFGRSSLYNRLKYDDELVAKCLGYTQGSGTFHIPEKLYEEILEFLSSIGIYTARGYGNGPSRKMKLISTGLNHLELSDFQYHRIKREFYLFSFVNNLRGIIHNNQEPIWYNRPFNKLVDYWKQRWAIPRTLRTSEWRNFQSNTFFENAEKMLEEL
jgi:uncharacterized protein YnzC (UPF0291/DUF896 family)